ncbi:FAD binding domain-containing protein [Cladophialophora immunda]|nr:FAD binding domain-containing protein [Cladophialophora immunda]
MAGVLSKSSSSAGHFYRYPSVRRYFATIEEPGFDDTYDVVVVGSGAAGLTAAFTAAFGTNNRVLVAEKTGYYGGTTAFSGGGLWVPGNPKMSELGIVDSRERIQTYLQEILGPSYQEDLISAFLDSAPTMVAWMEENSAVRFVGTLAPDYHMDRKGSEYGRTIMTKSYDGRGLGPLIKQVRYPLQGMCAFGSMQTDLSELNTWKRPLANWRNFSFCAKSLARYASDLVRYGKGTALFNGNALVGRLLESVKREGVDLWSDATALEPIGGNGQVDGLVIQKNHTNIRVRARKAVLLASGGFSRSVEWSRKYLPNADWSAGCRGNQGDGLRIGIALGGSLPPRNEDNALWSPISQLIPKRGPVRNFPHLALDRSKPGCIIVDGDGQRFANESAPYQPFGRNTHAAGVRKEYLVGDRTFLRRYGMGMALPAPYAIGHLLRKNYLLQAQTVPELAQRIGMAPAKLASTVDRFNQFARAGRDDDFHRGESIYDQSYGDPHVKPNPCLAPLEKPPFYALPLYPGNVSTLYGLRTNHNAQVLNSDGNPVRGLYALGADQNSIMKGLYPGGGSTLGPGMVFSYRAGLHLSGRL